MTITGRFRWPAAAVLILAGAVLFLVIRMYRNDVRDLKAFLASYDDFDKSVAAFLDGARPDGLVQAADDLSRLRARAAMRISSLVRNDGELMSQAREVAELAGQEVGALEADLARPRDPCPAAARAARRERSSEEARVLHAKRAAAYARFVELARIGGSGNT